MSKRASAKKMPDGLILELLQRVPTEERPRVSARGAGVGFRTLGVLVGFIGRSLKQTPELYHLLAACQALPLPGSATPRPLPGCAKLCLSSVVLGTAFASPCFALPLPSTVLLRPCRAQPRTALAVPSFALLCLSSVALGTALAIRSFLPS